MLEGLKYRFSIDSPKDDVKSIASYTVKNVSEALEIIKKINGVEY